MYRALEMLQMTLAFRQQVTILAPEATMQLSRETSRRCRSPLVYSLELGAFCLDRGTRVGKSSPLDVLTKGLVPLVSQFSDYKPETETDDKQC